MATNDQWSMDDFNSGALATDAGRGWSGQDWVDWYNRYHPKTATPASPDPAAAGPAPSGPISAPGDVSAHDADPLTQQAGKAQTYSDTPGAAPTQNTANQGTQDVVRNELLRKASQDTTVDTNDPNFRQQADTYQAAAERARRNAVSDNAAQFAGTGQGAQDVNTRMINEGSARDQASFESQLVGNELKNKRDEISSAIQQLTGIISGDQMRALQDKLAQLDATIKQQSLASSTALGSRELDIKSALGQGGLNIDMMRLLLANSQFNDQLGFNMSDEEARLNQQATLALLGQ
jgi:hypothetical protein